MKVSEITTGNLAEYLRLEYDGLTALELSELSAMLASALAFIRSYTGLDDAEIDVHEDFTIAAFILVQDMYDNRTLYIERGSLNKTVETILGMHSVNLL